MIVDEVKIHLKAGKGGEGSFCMVALVPTRKVVGGGGTGGRGGDCILKVTPHLYDLNKFREKRNYFAPDGIRGRENNKTGKGGEDMIVPVPAGTLIRDLDGQVVVDMLEPDQEFLVCRGGSGGEGNYKRDYTTPAQEGEELEAVLKWLPGAMDPGGAVVTLAYHSGEDRKIKQALRRPTGSRFVRRLPEIPGVRPPERPWDELTRRVVTPSPAERERNPRARSARLRAFRRTQG